MFDLCRPQAPWVVFGPRDAAEIEQQVAAFEAAGGRSHHLHARDLADMVSTCDAFAAALGFPGYFGRDWDALVDCLDDLHAHETGGVGIVVVVHGADVLLEAKDLRVLVSVLCQAADRAGKDVDPDGCSRERPVVTEHFVFLLDEVRAEEFAERIEDPDLVVGTVDDFLTVTLNLAVWRP
ncbi:barstar family protein [Streptomyces sp. NPDC002734]|uniref:barstar family protein n=1 Tax=Streptomyces sp. NPDC002734 TaxID=3154426 RepID=UPI0033288944